VSRPQEGWGAWSAYTAATTAAVPPSSPGPLALMSTTRVSATVSWPPPAESGGSPVTQYEVQLQAKSRAAQEQMGGAWLVIFLGTAQARR
jgi:hypothetical protein